MAQAQLHSLLLSLKRAKNGSQLVTELTNVNTSYLNQSDYDILLNSETSLSQKMDAFSQLQNQACVNDQSQFQLEVEVDIKNDSKYMKFSIGGEQIAKQEIVAIIPDDLEFCKKEVGIVQQFWKDAIGTLDIDANRIAGFNARIKVVELMKSKFKELPDQTNNSYIKNFMRLCEDFLYSHLILFHMKTMLEKKRNNGLINYMQQALKNADDVLSYPKSKLTSNKFKDSNPNILTGPLFYTFFVDPVAREKHKFPDETQRIYGDNMFETSNYYWVTECHGNYLDSCFNALKYLYDQTIKFSESTDAAALFGNLIQANRIAVGINNEEEPLNLGEEGVNGPEGHISLFYGCVSNVQIICLFTGQAEDDPDAAKFNANCGSRFYVPAALLNPCVSIGKRNNLDMLSLTKGDQHKHKQTISLYSKYESKEQIISFFSKHLSDYQSMLKQATTDDEKITAIVIFISVLEASHFFQEGNNRLFCQMLINNLLIENGLSQTILYIPNGFSRYVLGILPWEIRMGIVDLNTVPVSILANYLEPALMMVSAGQKFFQSCCSISS